MKYAKNPPAMKSPAVQVMKGTAHLRSRLYNPGAMKAHAWYTTQGAATKKVATRGVHSQMMEKPSIGSMIVSLPPGTPTLVSASVAGACTISHNCCEKMMHKRNATPKPIK